jgi:thiol-disulfide isomerase/thioredoxin
MSAQWAVIVALSVIVAVDSVAIIALTRQIGLLHLKIASSGTQPRIVRGPQQGSRLRLDIPSDIEDPDLVLFGFISPNCGGCAAMLPAFADIATRLPAGEQVVLASAADEARTRAYLTTHGITLPVVTGPQQVRANEIPSTPYAVAADRAGTVLAAGPVVTAAQLGDLISRARSTR